MDGNATGRKVAGWDVRCFVLDQKINEDRGGCHEGLEGRGLLLISPALFPPTKPLPSRLPISESRKLPTALR